MSDLRKMTLTELFGYQDSIPYYEPRPQELVDEIRRRDEASRRTDPYDMIAELCTELRNAGVDSDNPVLARAREMLRRHEALIESLERNSIRNEL